ncbi:cytochrome c [Chitinophaga sp. SYP-B3965]|uniref:cytochrome c n=1 Tax=Chitinophaga sp. SYP-B3965 TaxID=2663120 RepID=UPI0012998065|nr:cytochrome c [Chitinophaga sp. SYP-B3965]MRG43574.1 cytochrome c [Chitinophaga sp. SYP-B3965]
MRRSLFIILFTCASVSLRGQTFHDIEPILLTKCSGCHKPGEAGPFPLLKYEDFTKRLNFIKEVVSTGYMPPWRADTLYSCFANQRGLTAEEKTKILAWIDNKAPKGKASKDKPVTNTAANKRAPDLVLKYPASFLVKGNNKERFIEFKVPFELPAEKSIEAVEFVTNNRKIIHHINYGFYNVPDNAIDVHAGTNIINTDEEIEKRGAFDHYKQQMVYYTGWIPGSSTEYYPNEFGWTLPRRGVVIFTTHYAAIAADEESVIGVNLYFKDAPIKRPVRIISLGSGGVGERDIDPIFMIPPNEERTFTLKMKTPEEQSLLYVWPHMHFLGKSFEAYVVTPAGDTIRLINIPQWDFRWQELYRFKKPVRIPRGSIIYMKGTYDNTKNNPLNPNNPPKFVFSRGSMKSEDEMFTLLLIYAQYQAGDELMELE